MSLPPISPYSPQSYEANFPLNASDEADSSSSSAPNSPLEPTPLRPPPSYAEMCPLPGAPERSLHKLLWRLVDDAFRPHLNPEEARVSARTLWDVVYQLQPVKKTAVLNRVIHANIPRSIPAEVCHQYYKVAKTIVEKVALPVFLMHLIRAVARAKNEDRLNLYQVFYGSKIADFCLILKDQCAGTRPNPEVQFLFLQFRSVTEKFWKKTFLDELVPDSLWLGDKHLEVLGEAIHAGQSVVKERVKVSIEEQEQDDIIATKLRSFFTKEKVAALDELHNPEKWFSQQIWQRRLPTVSEE